MRQRLGSAAARLGDPPVLLFDELINGLDPEGIAWIRSLMPALTTQTRTVFLPSHVVSEVEGPAQDLPEFELVESAARPCRRSADNASSRPPEPIGELDSAPGSGVVRAARCGRAPTSLIHADADSGHEPSRSGTTCALTRSLAASAAHC